MSILPDPLQEIKALISSNTKPNKSFAYSNLLHFQEQSRSDHSSIQALAENSHFLISLIVADISDDDEEIAAQALKCLGFMIYHPSLVAAVPVDDVNLVLESLTKLITSTKMKSVCNLGVWCISIQQFNSSSLAAHFHSLLRAVVHALDNPFGSLSTTFEALQTVIKLTAQLSEKMRDSSVIWAPPIYRRLVSSDKRERDMSERCLLKISSTVFPPPLTLSKALVVDMKQKLLTGMKNLQNHCMKVQAMQAWGWFIRLLGSQVAKNRHLINDMLKIPEQSFSDHDPQVQIASLVAWEGLIDALIHRSVLACETNAVMEEDIQQRVTSSGDKSEIQAKGLLKSIKLIMTPLIGIISSKCDASLLLSCLNTWCYLLHKLDTSVNFSSVIKLVLEPIFEAVFQIGPDCKRIWSWNLCLDLLDDYILSKCRDVGYNSNSHVSHQLSASSSMLGPSVSRKCLWKHYPIKWLPWDLGLLDFHMKMISVLISPASIATVTHENRSSACDAALRIFRSVLKGVHMELINPSINYNEIMLCLNTILRFIKKTCEDVISVGSSSDNSLHTFFQFVEAITEEIEPSILGSPLYKVSLDLQYINNPQSIKDTRHAEVLGINPVAYTDMVSPAVYLSAVYFCAVVQSALNEPKAEYILQGLQKYIKFILTSYDLENFRVIIGLMYKHVGFSCLKIWTVIAKGLKDYIDGVKGLSQFRTESDSSNYFAVCHLLSYPFVVCFSPQRELLKTSGSSKAPLSSQRKLELECVIEAWKSLYGSVNCVSQIEGFTSNSFSEDLFLMLNGCLDEHLGMLESGTEFVITDKDLDLDLLSLYGDVIICVLDLFLTSEVTSDRKKKKGDNFRISDGVNISAKNYQTSSGINNSLGCAARFLKLSWTKIGTNAPTSLLVLSRVLSALARFANSLTLKHDILLFFEIIVSPLLNWLSRAEIQDQITRDQLQLLWAETLNCLQRSQPPISFDSAFLKLQAPLLEKTLDHPNPFISNPTTAFWNSTYGEEIRLDYPPSLLHVLDKLSRNGKINLNKRSPPFLVKCHTKPEVVSVPQKYKVTATHNRSSKRIELVEDTANVFEHKNKLLPNPKRKRLELTEHQKEVRRAQQGRERDCSGHGPGIRTYTSLDFSQGNEESQESQEIRDPDSILDMLRRAR